MILNNIIKVCAKGPAPAICCVASNLDNAADNFNEGMVSFNTVMQKKDGTAYYIKHFSVDASNILKIWFLKGMTKNYHPILICKKTFLILF